MAAPICQWCGLPVTVRVIHLKDDTVYCDRDDTLQWHDSAECVAAIEPRYVR